MVYGILYINILYILFEHFRFQVYSRFSHRQCLIWSVCWSFYAPIYSTPCIASSFWFLLTHNWYTQISVLTCFFSSFCLFVHAISIAHFPSVCRPCALFFRSLSVFVSMRMRHMRNKKKKKFSTPAQTIVRLDLYSFFFFFFSFINSVFCSNIYISLYDDRVLFFMCVCCLSFFLFSFPLIFIQPVSPFIMLVNGHFIHKLKNSVCECIQLYYVITIERVVDPYGIMSNMNKKKKWKKKQSLFNYTH